jgi:hypothetical protein
MMFCATVCNVNGSIWDGWLTEDIGSWLAAHEHPVAYK